jgi:2-phospho-L-lactate transferase/gluconeogenesis factor (CofD/UPF0052 family)
MEVIDFVDTIEKYIGVGQIDYVVVNSGDIAEDIVMKYKTEENKKPLKIKDYSVFVDKKYSVVERDLVNDEDYIRHDPERLSQVLEDIMHGWVK